MSQRLAYMICFFTVIVMLATGFYLEFVDGIMPCPLCTLQRICFAASGIIFLAGTFFYRKRCTRIAINLSSMIFASLGIFLAGRQLWIQYFPNPDNSECGVSLQYMISVLPLSDVAEKVFSGSTECVQRGWEFMKLNIPEWSLLFFVIFLLVSAFYLVTDHNGSR
ncbi:MAG TPA: disulfide bond formation protein B [Gammaproteobacteria bacterium]|nr:disulfide bond formation protein B [Gammaproteobacteria bacterium]